MTKRKWTQALKNADLQININILNSRLGKAQAVMGPFNQLGSKISDGLVNEANGCEDPYEYTLSEFLWHAIASGIPYGNRSFVKSSDPLLFVQAAAAYSDDIFSEIDRGRYLAETAEQDYRRRILRGRIDEE